MPFSLFSIFPALSALIALYGLTADPATLEQQFGMISSVLPAEAYDMVIEQIHRTRWHRAERSAGVLR